MRTTNNVCITGNLGADVELKDSKSGIEVARLSVAESVSRPNAKTGVFEHVHTNWVPVMAFGTLARRAAKSLQKGDRISVQGTLKTNSYEKAGEIRRGFEVIAQAIEKAQLLAKADGAQPDSVADFPPFDEFKER